MTTVWNAVIVAVGGAVGALLRWGIGEAALRWTGAAPLGTLAANLLGCFAIGAARAAVDAHGWGSPEVRVFVFTGLLGAFTTFSTFESDTVQMWRDGARGFAATYMGISVVGGLLCFLLGWWIVGRVTG